MFIPATKYPTQLPEISELLHTYFEGLYWGDTALLARVFHPDAHYVTATQQRWLNLSMDEYFHRVKHRPIPANSNQVRNDHVLAVDIIGPEAAMAKVTCSFNGRIYVDILSLVCLGGRWQIIHKLFHSEAFESA